jgi:hypothetical protein
MTRTNAPESEAMTLEEVEVFEAARQAAAYLRRSYEKWVDIGKAVMLARDMANRWGGGTRMIRRIIEQQNLGSIVDGPEVSRLLRIMPRIEEVNAWRATPTDRQKVDWASPQTIIKRCPIFRNPTPPRDDNQMTPAERDRQELARVVEENHELRRQLEVRDGGDTFNPRTSTPKEIALALFGQFQPYRGKAKRVARELTALVEDAVEIEHNHAEKKQRSPSVVTTAV